MSGLTRAAIDGDLTTAIGPATILTVFTVGALVSLLTFARAVSWRSTPTHVPTMTFLVGVTLGALRAPSRENAASSGDFAPDVLTALVIAGLTGVIVVLMLEYTTQDFQ